MLTRAQAIDLLINHPLKFARLLGFDKLVDLNEEWLKDMFPGKGKKDTSLQAHRLSYKTTCASLTLARIIILLPNKRTLFMRKTDSDVKEIVRQVQKILLDPRTQYIVQCIYGVTLKLTVSNACELSTNLTTDVRGTSQLVGMGIGSSLTGKHFDFIFTDDISNINDRISKAERENTKTVYQELQNIKNRGGRIYNTLTPWHPEDVSSIMPPAKKYDCYTTGLITPEQLEEIKASMINSLFAANYELRFVASEDVIFTNPQVGGDPSKVEQGIMHVDSAFYGEDFTAWSVMKKRDGKYYLYGRMKRKSVEDCYSDIMDDYERFMCGKMYNEDNADKGMVAKELRKLGAKVVVYHESMNKYMKIVTYLKAIWRDLYFVAGTDEEYINQICDYFEEAEHDDAPDSAASLARLFYNKSDNSNTQLLW